MLTQEAAGKWVLLDIDSGRYYALGDVGGRIWNLCDGTRTVPDLVAAVGSEYEGGGPSVEADVTTFVSDLLGEALLV